MATSVSTSFLLVTSQSYKYTSLSSNQTLNFSNTIANSPFGGLVTNGNLLSILSYGGDLNGCLLNCSRNGFCKMNANNQYYCACFLNYYGSSCEYDARPCANFPCLNNGTCINRNENGTLSYVCECEIDYYGSKCENEIDVCGNITCSYNGYCFKKNKLPMCKCFNLYEGEFCELQSNELKTQKFVVNIASIIAIISILICYLTFIFLDYLKYFEVNRNGLLSRLITKLTGIKLKTRKLRKRKNKKLRKRYKYKLNK